MTDREKLRDIRIYCNGVKHLLDCDELSKPSFGHMYDMLNAIYSIMAEPQYKSSGRPCFDKPAGVAIEHWETLEDNSNHIIDEMRYVTLGRETL